jgi:hypothetical protein
MNLPQSLHSAHKLDFSAGFERHRHEGSASPDFKRIIEFAGAWSQAVAHFFRILILLLRPCGRHC